jgi:hypothetical protein
VCDSLAGDSHLGRESPVATVVYHEQTDDPLFVCGDDTTQARLAQRHLIDY